MSTAAPSRTPRLSAVMREGEQVTPLELFFDLVFVLALTQCTALMAAEPTWEGLAKALLVLGVLWWSWVGYAWLTSVVDPEEGIVRLVIFAAMAAFLVAALCVPEAFDDSALLFACAYAVVRWAQIGLFLVASRDNPGLRRSVWGLAGGTALGVGLIFAAAFTDGELQGALWALALLLDMGEPYLFGSENWKLIPGHFAERHGLIIIIALGESIVAIGVGAEHGVDAGVVAAAVLGMAVAAAMWNQTSLPLPAGPQASVTLPTISIAFLSQAHVEPDLTIEIPHGRAAARLRCDRDHRSPPATGRHATTTANGRRARPCRSRRGGR